MTFEILDHLHKLEPDGGKDRKINGSFEKSYKCPVCGGHNFLVDQTTGRYLCTANSCDNPKIRAAIEPPKKPDSAPAAKATRPPSKRSWGYFTEKSLATGQCAVTVNRTDDGQGNRKISQKSHFEGHDPAEIRPHLLPYGIQEARAAVALGEKVFIVEGEPCVDACKSIGISAITFQGGTGGLLPDRDAGHIPPDQLVISPDQDECGTSYADKVADLYPGCKWFYPYPGDARWNGSKPSKGGLDIADWIAQGATKEQILKAVQPHRLEPAVEPSGATQGVIPEYGTDWIKARLQECLADGLTPGQIAVEIDRIAAMAEVYPIRVKDLLAGLRADESDAEDAAEVSAVISQADAAEQAIKTIRLEDYFPPKLCFALQVFQRGIPYQDLTLLMSQLVQVSSVLKLGTRINGNFFTDWEVPLNLYGIDVGPSGARKSPLVKAIFTKPSEGIKDQLNRANAQRFEAWEAECQTKKQNKPKQPRALTHSTNEYTGEGLADQLTAHEGNGVPLLVLRDEVAALFDSFGKYKQGGKGSGGDEQQLLEIFDGDGFHSLRVGAGRAYNRCHVSLYGGIQDDVLRRLIASGDANGKWARCIFVPLPEMTYLLKKPTTEDRDQRRNAEQVLKQLVDDLFTEAPRVFELDEDGMDLLNQYDHICQQQRNEASIAAIKALKNKSAGKALRIAGLLHLLHCHEDGEFSIAVPTSRLVQAIQLIDVLDDWTAAFHASAGLSKDSANAVNNREHLLQRIHNIANKAKGQVAWSEIRKGLKGSEKKGITAALAEVMIKTLHDRGLGEMSIGQRGGLCYQALRSFE